MRSPLICVAGLTREGDHIRPVPDNAPLARTCLRSEAGLFDIGAVVELGEVEDVGLPPEREDRVFALASAAYEFHREPQKFWAFQLKVCKPDLVEIFSPDLGTAGASLSVPLGKGN